MGDCWTIQGSREKRRAVAPEAQDCYPRAEIVETPLIVLNPDGNSPAVPPEISASAVVAGWARVRLGH